MKSNEQDPRAADVSRGIILSGSNPTDRPALEEITKVYRLGKRRRAWKHAGDNGRPRLLHIRSHQSISQYPQ